MNQYETLLSSYEDFHPFPEEEPFSETEFWSALMMDEAISKDEELNLMPDCLTSPVLTDRFTKLDSPIESLDDDRVVPFQNHPSEFEVVLQEPYPVFNFWSGPQLHIPNVPFPNTVLNCNTPNSTIDLNSSARNQQKRVHRSHFAKRKTRDEKAQKDKARKGAKKWTALKSECEQTVEKVKSLDHIFMSNSSLDDLFYAVSQSAKIHTRREEIFGIVDASLPSPDKRYALSILHKLRSFDEDSFIGKTMAVFDNEQAQAQEKLRALLMIQEAKEQDLRAREADAKNFLEDFVLSYMELDQIPIKLENIKEPLPVTPLREIELNNDSFIFDSCLLP